MRRPRRCRPSTASLRGLPAEPLPQSVAHNRSFIRTAKPGCISGYCAAKPTVTGSVGDRKLPAWWPVELTLYESDSALSQST